MKILLTGYKGFIGQNFLELAPKNWDIRLFEWGDDFPDVEGLDWVVHIGAISSTTETDIDKIMNQNLNFSIKLFEECIKHEVNFQWSSSASVYGLYSDFKESSVCKPVNLYAMSKYLFEQYIEKRKCHIKVQRFRYFNVYGKHEDHKGNQASPIHQFSKQAKENGIIKVFEGSENYRRDFVPVEKIIETHIKMMKSRESGVWNVGTGFSMSFMDVAKIIAEKHNATIEEIPFPKNLKLQYQHYTQADTTKLNESLSMLSKQENIENINKVIE